MVKRWRWAFIFIVFVDFARLKYLTVSQYFAWHGAELGKYFLPPHQSINYFISYVFIQWWLAFFLALTPALLFLFVAKHFNKKYNHRFFYDEEPYFLALAIFVAGWPAWVIYLTLVFVVYVAVSLFWLGREVISGADSEEKFAAANERRVSFYYFWLPLGAAAIYLSPLVY